MTNEREMQARIAEAFDVPPWVAFGKTPSRWVRWSWSLGGWLRARSTRRWVQDRGVH